MFFKKSSVIIILFLHLALLLKIFRFEAILQLVALLLSCTARRNLVDPSNIARLMTEDY